MRKLAFVFLVLLMVAGSVAMTSAQGPAPSVQSPPAGTKIAVAAPEVAPESILWDQPVSGVNTNAYADQDFEAAYNNYDIFLADDFTNAEHWTLRNIWVPGYTWNVPCALTSANSLTWQIYADAGGVPAGDPWSGGAYWSLTLSPTDPQVQLFTGSGGLLTNVWLTPTAPPVVPPGTWWLVFYPQLDFGPTGCQYGRQMADTANVNVAQIINPGNGFGGGATSWTSMQVYPYNPPVTQHDLAFRLSGSRNVMFEAGIDTTYRLVGTDYRFRTSVKVRELSGPKVPGASVTVQWTSPGGDTVGYPYAETNSHGVALIKWVFWETGTYTVCVWSMTKTGYTYDPAYNWETCDTVTVP